MLESDVLGERPVWSKCFFLGLLLILLLPLASYAQLVCPGGTEEFGNHDISGKQQNGWVEISIRSTNYYVTMARWSDFVGAGGCQALLSGDPIPSSVGLLPDAADRFSDLVIEVGISHIASTEFSCSLVAGVELKKARLVQCESPCVPVSDPALPSGTTEECAMVDYGQSTMSADVMDFSYPNGWVEYSVVCRVSRFGAVARSPFRRVTCEM